MCASRTGNDDGFDAKAVGAGGSRVKSVCFKSQRIILIGYCIGQRVEKVKSVCFKSQRIILIGYCIGQRVEKVKSMCFKSQRIIIIGYCIGQRVEKESNEIVELDESIKQSEQITDVDTIKMFRKLYFLDI
ncbi:hypothetical protein Taro_052709 [Colocasia esculenta]|uniref:Uncharacterized protein n=1 Tax=Colocasia esculenta TaxID=4460 RepID=A0A843XK30_COLES|nr:hypothetical protein [Colocasia esculenta]